MWVRSGSTSVGSMYMGIIKHVQLSRVGGFTVPFNLKFAGNFGCRGLLIFKELVYRSP